VDEHTRIIIGVRLEKAKDDIATAHELMALRRLRGAVNRAYYAIYHLATAVACNQLSAIISSSQAWSSQNMGVS